MSEAQQAILAVIRGIPAGEVRGYGEVARLAGLPGRARMVAQVLAGNQDANLPWYRVLRSSGQIAFPQGSRMFREQARRLKAEGVQVVNGRVRGLRVARSEDEALWGPQA